jgi:tRNA (guanine37-N1)-methyltransferase
MLFLKVPRDKGEAVRRELVCKGLFAKDYPILSETSSVLFPLTRYERSLGFELVQRDVEPKPRSVQSLDEALSGLLSEKEREELATSFDIIGDIAIIEIPETLSKHETAIGEALLKVHKNLKSVFKKLGPMEGEFRVRKVRCIAGEDRTATVYKESGAVMELDVAKVYFSVRLSHERSRIASLVKPKEKILALFAGVGPFPLVISKKQPSARIVAIELNPDAVASMEKNIERNRAKNVVAVLGDAREVVMRDYRDFADRVLMPLPKGAYDFLDVAFAGVKDGGAIHFYTFADIKDPFSEAMAKAEKAAKENGVSVEVIGKRIVRPYSPQTVQVVLDLIVRK